MGLFTPKFRVTEVSPKVVGFFFAQYCEVMKHGKDKVDQRMKDYLFSIITGLGVPESDIEVVEEILEELPLPKPIIHRRLSNG